MLSLDHLRYELHILQRYKTERMIQRNGQDMFWWNVVQIQREFLFLVSDWRRGKTNNKMKCFWTFQPYTHTQKAAHCACRWFERPNYLISQSLSLIIFPPCLLVYSFFCCWNPQCTCRNSRCWATCCQPRKGFSLQNIHMNLNKVILHFASKCHCRIPPIRSYLQTQA